MGSPLEFSRVERGRRRHKTYSKSGLGWRLWGGGPSRVLEPCPRSRYYCSDPVHPNPLRTFQDVLSHSGCQPEALCCAHQRERVPPCLCRLGHCPLLPAVRTLAGPPTEGREASLCVPMWLDSVCLGVPRARWSLPHLSLTVSTDCFTIQTWSGGDGLFVWLLAVGGTLPFYRASQRL